MPVHVEVADHIATVTLDRPPVNALSADAMRELTAAFRSFDEDRDVHVAILRSTGEKVFCAGADIKDSERRYSLRESSDADSAADVVDPGKVARDCFMAALDAAVPIISAVHGVTLGAGLALVACTDIIIAAEEATFGLPEINVGVLGGGRFLQRLVGVPKMRSMFFTGRPVSAQEMEDAGALAAVVPRAELIDRATVLAREIASKSPIGIRLGKQSLNRVESLSVAEGYRVEQDYTARVSTFDDAREARNAWREKREPQWGWH
jgi:enoyl-CoA hydratase